MNPPEMIAELKRDEGCVLTVYKDSLGHNTIGIGRLLDKPGGISMAEAEMLLQHDIARVCRELDNTWHWWRMTPEPVQRALVNMAFNLGIAGLKKFTGMIDALEHGDHETAAREALDSKWARQVGDRAQRVAAQIRG